MSNQSKAEKHVQQCIGEIVSNLENHKCGLSISDSGDILVSYEYKGDDGNDYILVAKAFDVICKDK